MADNMVWDNKWTRSVAAVGEKFAQKIREELGSKARGDQMRQVQGSYELRKHSDS
jgi:hypothetical protein